MAQTIDVSGLPQPVIEEIEKLIATLRSNVAQQNLPASFAESLSPEEFERELDRLSEGLPDLPTLPADFSREDIYCDHD